MNRRWMAITLIGVLIVGLAFVVVTVASKRPVKNFFAGLTWRSKAPTPAEELEAKRQTLAQLLESKRVDLQAQLELSRAENKKLKDKLAVTLKAPPPRATTKKEVTKTNRPIRTVIRRVLTPQEAKLFGYRPAKPKSR